jgi:hypothetical protein
MQTSLGPLCTAFTITSEEPSKSFNEVAGLVFKETSLFMALNELIETVSYPHVSVTNCARVVERLRHLIAPNVHKKQQSWRVLRQTLRVEKAYLEFITKHSTGPRHGDPTFVPGNIAQESMRRTWIIMNRFLEFRKRGNQPLPEAEFPLLS